MDNEESERGSRREGEIRKGGEKGRKEKKMEIGNRERRGRKGRKKGIQKQTL